MNKAAVHDMPPRSFEHSGGKSGGAADFYFWPTNIASQRCLLVLEEKGKLEPKCFSRGWKGLFRKG